VGDIILQNANTGEYLVRVGRILATSTDRDEALRFTSRSAASQEVIAAFDDGELTADEEIQIEVSFRQEWNEVEADRRPFEWTLQNNLLLDLPVLLSNEPAYREKKYEIWDSLTDDEVNTLFAAFEVVSKRFQREPRVLDFATLAGLVVAQCSG
jgi:hypothetical protein